MVQRSPSIFLSGSVKDSKLLAPIYEGLLKHSFEVFWAERDVPLGSIHREVIQRAFNLADVVLIGTSRSAVRSPYVEQEVNRALFTGKRVIPIFLERGLELIPPFDELKALQGVFVDQEGVVEKLVDGLKKVSPVESVPKDSAFQVESWLKLIRLRLKQIRCLVDFDLDMSQTASSLAMILGDNSAGKSTILKSIAIGLANESDATALLKELAGSLIRKGSDKATITLELASPEGEKFEIITEITRGSAGEEVVRKKLTPEAFPWDRIFVCGYGTHRTRSATASRERYEIHPAVRPLFNDDLPLHNPEVVLLRQPPHVRRELEQRLLSVLMLDSSETVEYGASGPELRGPWGVQPLQTLSDGYRSTTQWLLDFMAWAIYAGRFGKEIGGILLIDELEQHLHPRWQRHIVQRLCQQLPGTQIIASTHTPLTAAGAADVPGAILVRLEAVNGHVEAKTLDPAQLAGLRADQILASEAFDLPTTRNPGSLDDIDRLTELLSKKERNEEEEKRLLELRAKVEKISQVSESPAARQVESALRTTMEKMVSSVDPELLDLEAKRQLRQLFGGEEAA